MRHRSTLVCIVVLYVRALCLFSMAWSNDHGCLIIAYLCAFCRVHFDVSQFECKRLMGRGNWLCLQFFLTERVPAQRKPPTERSAPSIPAAPSDHTYCEHGQLSPVKVSVTLSLNVV